MVAVRMKSELCLLAAWTAFSAGALTVTVDPAGDAGPVKPMNGVNNGPVVAWGSSDSGNYDRGRSNFAWYKALEIPFARTHDANFFNLYGGPHTVDVTAVFPDFDKDERDPASYDFACTDKYLSEIRAAGAEIVYRLGQTIEYPVKKYGVVPPKDDAKWARICEGIVRHYNEGWANGFRWNVRKWEIWNEADNWATNRPATCWCGSPARFHDFYETAARHLKKTFPGLEIGGPAVGWNEAWAEEFIVEMGRRKVPIDFFSWHCYAQRPEQVVRRAKKMRALLDANGYAGVPTTLDEWNYIRGWTDEIVYSLRAEQGMKGAAFAAGVMCAAQTAPVDFLCYYDARPSEWNGIFDRTSFRPLKGYWAFLAWRDLRRLGRALPVTVDGAGLYAAAARDDAGRLGVLVVRYTDDDNDVKPKEVTVRLAGGAFRNPRCRMTDADLAASESPVRADGAALTLTLEPNAFVYIESER